jgi:hemoglobin
MTYGVGDASYQAAGGFEGLQRLTKDFYALMEQLPEAAELRSLHGDDLSISQDKLACFLSGWLGGPKLFSEKYGSISIPAFHSRWPINDELSQSWLNCMAQAIARQPFAPDFADYLLAQLRVPAQRSVEASRNRHGG